MSRQERDPAGLQGVRLGDYARVFTKEYVQKVSHGRVSTGFPGVDRSLNGGFSSGLYVLGAVPGLGKSTLALQIAHNVSKQGVPALYFALEMDRDWITAKSISRSDFEKYRTPLLQSSDLFNPDRVRTFSQEAWDREREAVERLEQEERNFYLYESGPGCHHIGHISQEVRSFRRTHPEGPILVVIDYLQILAPREETQKASDKQVVDDNVRELCNLRDGEKVIILLISALNRSSYWGPIELDSFKESGSIEYSADVIWGLQYQGIGKRGNQLDAEKALQDPRALELVLLKMRYGQSGGRLKLNFFSGSSFYEEPGVEGKPVSVRLEELRQEFAHLPLRCHDGYHRKGRLLLERYGLDEERVIPVTKSPLRDDFTVPDSFIMNNCKIANELRRYRDLTGCVNRAFLSPKEEQNRQEGPYVDYVITKELTYLDMMTANAAYTLLSAAPREKWNGETIGRLLSGDMSRRVPPKQRKELENCLRKLASTRLTILADHDGRDTQDVYEGAFLPIEEDQKGQFRFIPDQQMPLYQYAKEMGQMITVPIQWFQAGTAKEKSNSTNRTLMLRHYLLQELEVIRNDRNHMNSKHIRLLKGRRGNELGLLWILGVREQGEQENVGEQDDLVFVQDLNAAAKRTQTTICQILDGWQAQDEYTPLKDEFGVQLHRKGTAAQDEESQEEAQLQEFQEEWPEPPEPAAQDKEPEEQGEKMQSETDEEEELPF